MFGHLQLLFCSRFLIKQHIEVYLCTGTMTSLPPLTQARYGHSCVLKDNRIIVAGGNNINENSLNLVEMLDLRLVQKHLPICELIIK
jgi:hypothetical protein